MHECKENVAEKAEEEKNSRAFDNAVRRVCRAAKREGHFIEQGRDSMGCVGFRVTDDRNVIVGGENFELDLETIAGWYGIDLDRKGGIIG